MTEDLPEKHDIPTKGKVHDCRGLPGLSSSIAGIHIFDDIYSDFFPKREQEEVKKVIDRYIKKTKPFYHIESLLPEDRLYVYDKRDIFFVSDPVEYRPRCDIKTREEQNVFTQKFGTVIRKKKKSD